MSEFKVGAWSNFVSTLVDGWLGRCGGASLMNLQLRGPFIQIFNSYTPVHVGSLHSM
jgi:hypothetical protein